MVKKDDTQKKDSKNFYLIIFELLKKNIRPSQTDEDGKEFKSIAFYLKKSKQNIQYYLSSMKKAQLVEKLSNGTWITKKDKLTQEDLNLIDQVKKTTQVHSHDTQSFSEKQSPNTKRGHGYRFVLKLPKIPKWDNRDKILTDNKIPFKTLNNLGGGQKLDFEGKKVHLKNHSIIIYETDSFFSLFAKGINKTAIFSFFKVVKALEKHLGADFSKKGKYAFKIVFSEIGLIKNALAEQYNEDHKKLHVSNIHGEFMLIDNSFNLNELEIHQNREGSDKVNDRSELMAEWINDLDQDNYKTKPSVINNRFLEVNNNFNEATGLILEASRRQLETDLIMKNTNAQLNMMEKQISFIVDKLKDLGA